MILLSVWRMDYTDGKVWSRVILQLSVWMSYLPFWATCPLKQDTGLFLGSLPSPGISPWKYFIEQRKEDTSHLYCLPCWSWLPLLQEKIKLYSLHKLLLALKKLSFSKPLLIIHVMVHPTIFLKMAVWLAYQLRYIGYQKTLFCFWSFYL